MQRNLQIKNLPNDLNLEIFFICAIFSWEAKYPDTNHFVSFYTISNPSGRSINLSCFAQSENLYKSRINSTLKFVA